MKRKMILTKEFAAIFDSRTECKTLFCYLVYVNNFSYYINWL